MSISPCAFSVKLERAPEVEKRRLCLSEEMHHRHRGRKTSCVGGQGRIEVGLPNVRRLTMTRSTIVIVPERSCHEHAGNDDVTKAKHSKASFTREEQGLGPQELDGDVQVRGYLDHLEGEPTFQGRTCEELRRTHHFRAKDPPNIVNEKTGQKDDASLERIQFE